MCEYCGCQDIEQIADLTAEHDRLRELGRGLAGAARADDIDTARGFAREMRDVFAPHVAVEEQGLFPVMAAEFPEQIEALGIEHKTMDDALSAIIDGPLPDDWHVLASDAVHELFEHILKEQDGVFPASVTTLEPHDWDALDEIRARVGSAVLSSFGPS
jgi:hemerythrin-like domain-containing protein